MFQKHEKSDKVKNEVFLEDVEVSKYRFLWLQILISVYLICNYRHHLVLKMQVPDHYFLKYLEIPYWKSSFSSHRQILCRLSSKVFSSIFYKICIMSSYLVSISIKLISSFYLQPVLLHYSSTLYLDQVNSLSY